MKKKRIEFSMSAEKWKELEHKSYYARVSMAEWVRMRIEDRWKENRNEMKKEGKCYYPYKLTVSMEEGMVDWIEVMSEVNRISKSEVIRNCI